MFLVGPRNLSITPRKNIYTKGDHLHCSASSNPPSAYKWREIDTEHVVYGPYLIVDETMQRRHITYYRCTAENTVAGEKKSTSEIITIETTSEMITINAKGNV